MTLKLGFRIVGACRNERRLIAWTRAFQAYADCTPDAAVDSEGYLSAFTFGQEFREHFEATGSTRGYRGPCGSSWLWLDIDREGDLEAATGDTRRLCGVIADRFQIEGDKLLIFFSGAKGYHIGLPASLCGATPSVMFHKYARRFMEDLAAFAKVEIDVGIYDRVRAFRAPNSRHAKTGLHKRRLEFDELMYVSPAGILERAAQPEPFEILAPPTKCDTAQADWQNAVAAVTREIEAVSQQKPLADSDLRLNRLTREFICTGAANGDRHRLLYSAAANLAEFGCPTGLAFALLSEPARDAGLAPRDVKRQIECGLQSGNAGSGEV